MRDMSNTGADFLLMMADVLLSGAVLRGQIIVLDNAAIHHCEENALLLSSFLDISGCRFVFLPTYSPEFNPCELLFAMSKRYMMDQRWPRPGSFRNAI